MPMDARHASARQVHALDQSSGPTGPGSTVYWISILKYFKMHFILIWHNHVPLVCIPQSIVLLVYLRYSTCRYHASISARVRARYAGSRVWRPGSCGRPRGSTWRPPDDPDTLKDHLDQLESHWTWTLTGKKFNLTIALCSKIVGKLVLTARAARAFYDRGPDLKTDLGTQDMAPNHFCRRVGGRVHCPNSAGRPDMHFRFDRSCTGPIPVGGTCILKWHMVVSF